MIGEKGSLRYPALLVGVGGTGITCLRFLKAVARHSEDETLRNMLEEGSLQLLGIDTDQGANDPGRSVDRHLLPGNEGLAGAESLPFRHLPPLDDFIHVPAEDITRALMAVRLSVRELDAARKREQGEPESLVHRQIAEWFPPPSSDVGDEISYGQSRLAGAAQWRPLGRVGLFVKASDIYSRLGRMHQEIAGAIANDPLQKGPVRAYVVGSIAGGTGSGMFWDVAMMLRTLSDSMLIQGAFVLPDVFVELDRARRVLPNAYAALKELAHLKNWTWNQRLEVRYPNGVQFTGYQGGRTVFDKVYLYKDFKPGEEVADFLKARVDVTCMRIAQNILTQLRHDIHLEIDQGANNESGDATQMHTEATAKFVFSTSGALEYQWDTIADVERRILSRGHALLYRWFGASEGARWRVANDKLLSAFYDEGAERRGGMGAGEWLKVWVDRLGKRMDEGSAAGIEEWRSSLESGIERLQGRPADVGLDFSYLRTVYRESVPQLFRNYIARVDSETGGTHFKPSPEEVFGKEAEEPVGRLEAGLNRLADEMEVKGLLLAEDDLEELVKALNLLKEVEGEWKSASSEGVQLASQHHRHLRLITWGETEEGLSIQRGWDRFDDRLLGSPFFDEPELAELVQEELYGLLSELLEQLEELRKLYGPAEAGAALWRLMRRTGEEEGVRSALARVIAAHRLSRKRREEGRTELANSRNYWPEAGEAVLKRDDYTLSRSMSPTLNAFARDVENEYVIRGHARQLAKLWHPRRVVLELNGGESCGDEKWWLRFFEVVAMQLEPTRPEGVGSDPAQTLALVMERDELWPLKPEHCRHHGAMQFDQRLKVWQELLSLAVSYMLGAEAGALARIGGPQGLAARLQSSHSHVVTPGSIDNPIAKRNLVLVKTHDDFQLHGQDIGEMAEKALDRAFSNAAQSVFGVVPRISNRHSGFPVIYYEDLYRSATELDKVEDYREAYLALPAEKRRFYHLFRGVDGLGDIVTSSIPPYPVFCGNEDCDYDLRYLPRTTLICPGCGKPIWNRCGNLDCGENHLLDRFRKENDGQLPENFPHQCPECHNELRTYWWYCDDPAHRNFPIPSDKASCPRCLSEYQRGVRAYQEVRRRADRRQLICPGCEMPELKLKRNEKTQISEELGKFYSDGVNGHDSTTFTKLVKKSGLMEHNCPQQKRIHLLFPTCPVEDEGGGRHHLFRNHDGKFVCTHHPQKKFFECFHCGYPIDHDDPGLVSHGRTHCPRCMRELRKCHYCSEQENRLYQPSLSGLTGREHCPRCSNHMEPQESNRALLLNGDFERAAFCRNIFNCKAAADPWHTASDYEKERCRVCTHESGLLLDRNDLRKYISHCPVCLSLFGLPREVPSSKGQGIDTFDAVRLAAHFSRHPEDDERMDEPCIICATRPKEILGWILGDLNNGNVDVDSDVIQVVRDKFTLGEGKATPEISSGEFISLLRVLTTERNNRRALRMLRDEALFRDRWNEINQLRTMLLPLFEPNLLSAISFNKRMVSICQFHEKDRMREQEVVSFVTGEKH